LHVVAGRGGLKGFIYKMEFEISVVGKAKERAGGIGSVKAIVAGAEEAFDGRVVEEFAMIMALMV